MRKTKAEIIQAMEYCVTGTGCFECSYFSSGGRCMSNLRKDALELIKQMDAELTALLYGQTIPGKEDKQ